MSNNGAIEPTQTKEIFNDQDDQNVYGNVLLLQWLAGAGETLPPWWSQARDAALRSFWKSGDHLSGTVATMRYMFNSIPFKVSARDKSVRSHVRAAAEYQDLLQNRTISRSNFSEVGWHVGYGSFIEDYHTQDNGAFMVVEGPGRPDGPLTGMPTKLIHLDSYQVMRTGSREYPIIYTDYDGKRYKIHTSRVIATSSMSSPIAEMYGVGFCAVSRAIGVAQNLMDISRYKQEKLGSRPMRGIIVGSGIPTRAIQDALALAGEQMDNAGLDRYAQVPIIGSNKDNIELNLVDLASLPDGYNELESAQLGMTVLALAFGVDVRQLAFAIGVAGQTRADAEIQHAKMRGKAPGAILRKVEAVFMEKVLPPYLKMEFDFQDDEQDKTQAEIKDKRTTSRERDLGSGVISIRVAREQALESGDLNEAQFEQLELDDGRLPDGSDILALWQSNDPQVLGLLGEMTTEGIDDRIAMVQKRLMTAPLASQKQVARQVLAALMRLKEGDKAELANEAEQPEEGEGVPAEEKETFSYALTQFDTPDSVAVECMKLALAIAEDDRIEIEDKPHITIKYGLLQDEPWRLVEIVNRGGFAPIEITFGQLSLFENDEVDVLKIEVESEELRRLNMAIAAGVKNVETHPVYNPHLTIAYLKPGAGQRYIGDCALTNKSVTVDTITLSRRNGVTVKIPLPGKVYKESFFLKSLNSYRKEIRANIRGYFNGKFGYFDFVDNMNSAINRRLTQAWIEGAKECGIAFDELTTDERNTLQDRINSELAYIPGLANDIDEAVEVGGKITPLLKRADLWANRYEEVKNQAKVMVCKNAKLEWVLGEAEHCTSCLKLSGKVKRASYWNDKGVIPRVAGASYLECKGYNCKCELKQTGKPLSKGPLPKLP